MCAKKLGIWGFVGGLLTFLQCRGLLVRGLRRCGFICRGIISSRRFLLFSLRYQLCPPVVPKLLSQVRAPKLLNQSLATKLLNQFFPTKLLNQFLPWKLLHHQFFPSLVPKLLNQFLSRKLLIQFFPPLPPKLLN